MVLQHVVSFFAFVVAVLVTSKVVPGIRVKSFTGAILFALAFALLNKLLFPLLLVFTLPLVIFSLGLFIVVINAFLFWLADKVVGGVEVDGFGSALFGSIVTSAVNWMILFLIRTL